MKHFLLILIFLVVVGCTSDDAVDPSGDQWVLDNVVCFCFFGEDFDFSAHRLQFNRGAGTVTIENEPGNEFIAPAGTYNYTDSNGVIGIEGREYRYEEDGDTLILTFVDDPIIADDEVVYYYSKN
nr:hypothetical protein [Allomuricauda sp.]